MDIYSAMSFKKSSLRSLRTGLRLSFPNSFSPNQSAIVKNRLLLENLLLATEVIKDYHKDAVSPRCALKIDISKAFDSVQWSYLLTTLRALGFSEQYVKWIRICITTASFSVQVNGELAGYFGSKHGLRQGCSFSPYLFFVCMNVLSRRLDVTARNEVFDYHLNCKNLQLTHLCFANDLMVFVAGNQCSVMGVLRVFDDFSIHLGLKVSLEKSTIYTAGVAPENKVELLQQFPYASGTFPVRYLDLPLSPKRMSTADYSPLLEKIRLQISNWTTRMLSFAGHLQLIRSVIFSLINFWLSAFRLPKACIRELHKMCYAFLWSGPCMNARKIKVAWSEVYLPKSEGGLGLHSIEEANKINMLKLIWKVCYAKDSMWVVWVKHNLLRGNSLWAVSDNTTGGSWIWKKILKYRELAKQFHLWRSRIE